MRVAGFDFEKLLNTIDYKELPILEWTISTEVIKVPRGTGRLQVTRNNLDKKRSVIRIKNVDTMCLARAIVTALAIQEPEKWTTSQLHNIKKSRGCYAGYFLILVVRDDLNKTCIKLMRVHLVHLIM